MQLTNEQVAGIPRTPWFPGSVKPARPGVYQVKPLNAVGVRFALWNGSYWLISSISVERASRYGIRSSHQNRVWRGLARDPYAEGEHRKKRGIKRALAHAGDDWKHAALNKLREFVARHVTGHQFAFETFRAWALNNGLEPPPDHHAWGGVAYGAVSAGIVRHTGKFRAAVSPATHRHPVRMLEAV